MISDLKTEITDATYCTPQISIRNCVNLFTITIQAKNTTNQARQDTLDKKGAPHIAQKANYLSTTQPKTRRLLLPLTKPNY